MVEAGGRTPLRRPADGPTGRALKPNSVRRTLRPPRRAIGYHLEDIPALVAGTLPQKRILALCPRPVDEESLGRLFEDSMAIY